MFFYFLFLLVLGGYYSLKHVFFLINETKKSPKTVVKNYWNPIKKRRILSFILVSTNKYNFEENFQWYLCLPPLSYYFIIPYLIFHNKIHFYSRNYSINFVLFFVFVFQCASLQGRCAWIIALANKVIWDLIGNSSQWSNKSVGLNSHST